MLNASLVVFNPESDLALANADPNYMAPFSARLMAKELAPIAMWYAPDGAAVLLPESIDERWMEEQRNRFNSSFPTLTEMEDSTVFSAIRLVNPWGWNPMLINRLKKLGVPDSALLDEQKVQWYRKLSHRSQAVKVLTSLRSAPSIMLYLCGQAEELKSGEATARFVEKYAECVLKEPISGSGKGLYWCSGHYTPHIRYWVDRILACEGSVIGEPLCDKVVDFAMEFYSEGAGKIRFVGYSLFATNRHGAYLGNALDTDESIEKQLSSYLSSSHILTKLKELLCLELTLRISPFYTGYLGVDMMICHAQKGEPYRIHPCVEINMRMNMGCVAHLFRERFVAEGSKGNFHVDYFASPEQLMQTHEEKCRKFPLQMENGRIIRGYMSLTPVSEGMHYLTSVLLKS